MGLLCFLYYWPGTSNFPFCRIHPTYASFFDAQHVTACFFKYGPRRYANLPSQKHSAIAW